MRTDIRLNGSDLTMALARASHWERHAKHTRKFVEDGLLHMNDALKRARGNSPGRFGDKRDLTNIIVTNGNLIYHALSSERPDLFVEVVESEAEEEEEEEDVEVCHQCGANDPERDYYQASRGGHICSLCIQRVQRDVHGSV